MLIKKLLEHFSNHGFTFSDQLHTDLMAHSVKPPGIINLIPLKPVVFTANELTTLALH